SVSPDAFSQQSCFSEESFMRSSLLSSSSLDCRLSGIGRMRRSVHGALLGVSLVALSLASVPRPASAASDPAAWSALRQKALTDHEAMLAVLDTLDRPYG